MFYVKLHEIGIIDNLDSFFPLIILNAFKLTSSVLFGRHSLQDG